MSVVFKKSRIKIKDSFGKYSKGINTVAEETTEEYIKSIQKVGDKYKQLTEEKAAESKRYAVGGVIDEDVNDNAKYYYEQSKEIRETIERLSKFVIPKFFIDFETGELKSDGEAKGMRFWINDGVFYGEVEERE